MSVFGGDVKRILVLVAMLWPALASAQESTFCKIGILTQGIDDYINAIELLTFCLDENQLSDVERAYIFATRGQAHLDLGASQKAYDDFYFALELDDTQSAYWIGRGRALYDLENFEVAEGDLTKGASLNPNDALAPLYLGLIHTERGEKDQAIAKLDRALALDPDSLIVRTKRGEALLALNRPRPAIDDFARAIELDPKDAELHNLLGLALRGARRMPEALAEFDRALEMRPYHPEYLINRGISYRMRHEFKPALADLSMAIEIDPTLADAFYARAEIYIATGRKADAIKDLNRALAIEPNHEDASDALDALMRMR